MAENRDARAIDTKIKRMTGSYTYSQTKDKAFPEFLKKDEWATIVRRRNMRIC